MTMTSQQKRAASRLALEALIMKRPTEAPATEVPQQLPQPSKEELNACLASIELFLASRKSVGNRLGYALGKGNHPPLAPEPSRKERARKALEQLAVAPVAVAPVVAATEAGLASTELFVVSCERVSNRLGYALGKGNRPPLAPEPSRQERARKALEKLAAPCVLKPRAAC